MITAQIESFTERLEELMPLLPVHWKKLALNQDTVPLDPQFDIYIQREALGQLLFITLRDAGKMVGYWIAFIAPGLHYKTCLTATMDIWNVLPEYERTRAPLILMNEVEKAYKKRGVMRSFAGEKLVRPCGKIYEKYGYAPVERTFSKMFEV